MKLNWLIVIVILTVLAGAAGCRKAPEIPPDTFNAAYTFKDGRNVSISGRSHGMPGEQMEYILKINNNAEHWQGRFYVLLVDSDSVIQEISHEQFDISGGGGMQKPFKVELPEGFEGALGLCVKIPESGILIAALTAGDKSAVSTGWPDINNWPVQPAVP